MDIKLEKKPWYIRYRYYLAGAFLVCCGLIYVIVLASGPRRLRINAEHIQIEEVKQADFMEYVDVEGIVHPILTIIVNTREVGNVDQAQIEAEVQKKVEKVKKTKNVSIKSIIYF